MLAAGLSRGIWSPDWESWLTAARVEPRHTMLVHLIVVLTCCTALHVLSLLVASLTGSSVHTYQTTQPYVQLLSMVASHNHTSLPESHSSCKFVYDIAWHLSHCWLHCIASQRNCHVSFVEGTQHVHFLTMRKTGCFDETRLVLHLPSSL